MSLGCVHRFYFTHKAGRRCYHCNAPRGPNASLEIVWTLANARDLIRTMLPALQLAGYEVALAGSVLKEGMSAKDLDLVIFPISTATQDLEMLRVALRTAGLVLKYDEETVKRRWRTLGSEDEKHVEIFEHQGRRIDIFFLR